MKLLLYFLLLTLLSIHCYNNNNSKLKISRKVEARKIKPLPKPAIVYVQPFSDIQPTHSRYVFNSLKKIFPQIQLLTPIPLPKSAFYSARSRYRADSIIHWLQQKTDAKAIAIGLTSKDISVNKGQHKDWGIMGLSFRPGNACVVSSYRLHKKAVQEELFMVAVHELGHAQGLFHCPQKQCYMRDAEGKGFTGQEKGFCSSCKNELQRKGWRI